MSVIRKIYTDIEHHMQIDLLSIMPTTLAKDTSYSILTSTTKMDTQGKVVR